MRKRLLGVRMVWSFTMVPDGGGGDGGGHKVAANHEPCEQHRFGVECVPIMVIADTIMRNAYRMLRIAATRI